LAARLPPAQRRFADRVQFARDGLEYGRLMAEYQAMRRGRPVDHAAVVAFLEEHGSRIAAIADQYPSGDPYWPPLAPSWALGEYNVDRLLAHHRARLAGLP
jgi:hypothetical protein